MSRAIRDWQGAPSAFTICEQVTTLIAGQCALLKAAITSRRVPTTVTSPPTCCASNADGWRWRAGPGVALRFVGVARHWHRHFAHANAALSH
jgi:hypothetical protein